MSFFGNAISVDGDQSAPSITRTTMSQTQQYEVYSESQTIFLSIAPKISSVLSIVGCAWIVMEVWWFSNKRYYVYHKIVSAMALYCALVGIWYFVADWATAYACRAQGYFVQLSLAPMLYFAMLFLYYTLVISYTVPEQRLTSNSTMNLRYSRYRLNWHQIFHLIPFTVGSLTASISLPLDLLHPSPSTSWCWIAEPTFHEAELDDSSHRFLVFQWAFYLGPAWLAFLAMMVLLFVVFQGVETQERRMKKYITASTIRRMSNGIEPEVNLTFGRKDSTSLCCASTNTVQPENLSIASKYSPPAAESFVQNAASSVESYRTSNVLDTVRIRIFPSQEYWEHRPRTRQVLVQCFCYVGAFFGSVLFLTVNEIFVWMRFPMPVPYPLAALQCIYQPLLGFTIFLAYRRPFYMRIRRQGLSRGQSLLKSCKWNQNPVNPPGLRGSPLRRQKESMSTVKLSAEEIEQRTQWARQVKEQRRKLLEERRQQKSSIVGRFLRSTSIRSGENMPETEKEIPKRTQSAPIPENGPSEESISDCDNEEDVAQKDWMSRLESLNATSGIQASTKNENDSSENCESYSTLGTRRTSLLTRDGSSHKFDPQNDELFGINESSPAFLQEEDDQSISLEDLVHAERSDDMNEGESDGEDLEGGDLEAKEPSGSHIGFYMSFLGRREAKNDFDLIKQSSDTYKDLVFMDIFPEADGAMEKKWRAIEARVSRYKKTKHDKYKLSMSVPVISERHFGSNTMLLGTQDIENLDLPPRREDEGKIRFAWAKNPLFKISGRQRRDVLSPNRLNNASTANSGSSEICKAVPKRTSSGGFFSVASKDIPDEKFMAKLEKEKSRQALLQAISSRRIHSAQSAEGDEWFEVLGVATIDDSEINIGTTRDRRPVYTSPKSSNPLLDAGVDPDWISDGDDQIDAWDCRTFKAIPPEVARNQLATREVACTATWRSNQSLEDIPETSEHSERGAMRRKSANVDKPPKRAKRISSGELSTRVDGFESSNEFTDRSAGSIRTIKRSNLHESNEIQSSQRHSHSSELTSDGVSLVSDDPMSDDGFLSDSSDDNDDTKNEHAEKNEHLRISSIQSRFNSALMRSSLGEMQRVSERSKEVAATVSSPEDGMELTQGSASGSDMSERTENA
jgi:hypothetical protein